MSTSMPCDVRSPDSGRNLQAKRFCSVMTITTALRKNPRLGSQLRQKITLSCDQQYSLQFQPARTWEVISYLPGGPHETNLDSWCGRQGFS